MYPDLRLLSFRSDLFNVCEFSVYTMPYLTKTDDTKEVDHILVGQESAAICSWWSLPGGM